MQHFRSKVYSKPAVEKRLTTYLEEKTKDKWYDLNESPIVITYESGRRNERFITTTCFLGKGAVNKYFVYCSAHTLDTSNQLQEIASFLQKRVFFYNMVTRTKEELLVNLRIAVTMLEKIALSRREKDAIFDSIIEAFYDMYKLVNDWYLEYVECLPFVERDKHTIPF